MSSHPNKISVVIPAHNSARFIEHTLNSVLAQTVAPYEVIVVDNMSKDNTQEVLELWKTRFASRGIKFVTEICNRVGAGAARNVGCHRATGDWLAFLDSDDMWAREKLENVEDVIRSPQFSANFIVNWEETVFTNGSKLLLKNGSRYVGKSNLPRQIYRHNAFSTSAVCVAKTTFDESGGFDEDFLISQDYEFWLRLSPKLRIHVIEKILGSYVLRDGNITSRPYWKRYAYLQKILWKHLDKGGPDLFLYRSLRALLSKSWWIGS